ncbi:purine and uridine phosphorylase [Aspergillus lucknowensis]|uniref:Purine and uridine phosphorylase n=1 Tax=Aspergillus lucknowensis TaxID=176173 RepID=A0ABR4L912_9EURO
MGKMTLTHDSYTVAWICALPLELAAAKAILDEVHPALPQPESDHNVYTLGSASGRNVVVVCLPAGVYGTVSAATTVSHLKSTYRRVRFGLMVGIGGGVPRENFDIRLGDVVVSKPTNTLSGVIQYDYGKKLHDGHFHRTGSLNKPPPILLKAIAQMESDRILGQNLLGKIMSNALQKEDARNQFPRPSKDQLFRSTYNHKSDGPDCSACDEGQLVDRPERTTEEPFIYYGLIASGDQVMKDARARDLIAQELDILCFEMEAAGFMDEMPSLVIRGICDYCDSHKHKEWQPYAAFVAAAYAKAVLMQVPQEQNIDVREAAPEKRHWMVPFLRSVNFVGREEELAKIEDLTQSGQSRIAICGLGGVGKTQIAIELAYRTRERDLSCSIFWIPCTSYANVEQAYLGIAETLAIQGVQPTEVKEHVKSYLSRNRGQKWLLIFDNADDMDMWFGGGSVTTALIDFLPQSEQGCILFTTRNRKLAVKLASSSVINISEPDTETGLKILENGLIRKDLMDKKEAAVALLEQLMFLPLAITQAAAYISSNDIELELDVIEVLSEDFGGEGRYKEIINPQIQQKDPLAADYLAFMACINPRNIPQSLLPEALSKKKRIDAVGILKAFSFINEHGKDNALSLHRLVYLATRNWLRKQGQFSLYIQKAADHFSQIWRKYLPHALSMINEEPFKTEQRRYIKLIRNIARCLQADGRYNEAVIGGSDRDLSALTSLADLGSIYWSQGRWNEAEKLEVQVMETSKTVLGAEHPDTLSSTANLASTYWNQGRWNKAEKLMANLASTYWNQGRWNEAEKLFVQVIETSKRVLGADHPDTLSSMANLASTYRNQGRWNDAEKLFVQVMEKRKTVLGAEHPSTLASMHNLAHTWHSQKKTHDAFALMGECLMLRSRVLGSFHPHSISSSRSLENWKEQAERHSGAPDQCFPDVVVTKPPDDNKNYTSVDLSHGRTATPIKRFVANHPLLAWRSSSPAPGAYGLQDID